MISEYEFPTVGQIAHAQELRGAEVVHVRPEADGSIPAERFAEAIDERTALVCCTTISYRTGPPPRRRRRSPRSRMRTARSCSPTATRRRGRSSSTCARSAPTSSPAERSSTCSPRPGLGFLWVRRELLAGLLPTQTGWFADEDIFRMDISDYSPHATARRFDAGHAAGAEHLRRRRRPRRSSRRPGVPAIEAHVSALNTRLIDGLEELGADRRHARRPGPARAARLRRARPMPRRSSPRSPRRTSSARCATRTSASPRTSTTPRTTSTRCSTRSSPPPRTLLA